MILDADQAASFQAAQRHSYRGRGDPQQVGQARGNYLFALAFRFEDRLEIVLLETVIIGNDYTMVG